MEIIYPNDFVRFFNEDEEVDEVVVNDKEKYEEVKSILKGINKDYLSKLKLIENQDIFDLYKVQSQINKALNKKVWLKSGGYLIIDRTEALTVIDVNTGKFTGNSNREDTVYKTNKEACIEIARQLRLRDIGGIIIIDFIDMTKKNNKESILKDLREEFQKDKRKSEVLGFTRLNLMEVARRREKNSIEEYYLENCSTCDGNSFIKSLNYIMDDLEKEISRIKNHTCYNHIVLEVNPSQINLLKANYMDTIQKISEKYEVDIKLREIENASDEKYKIIYSS